MKAVVTVTIAMGTVAMGTALLLFYTNIAEEKDPSNTT